ncbi:hypothetical protein HCN44_008233 [Aphidius gifuensis]|uniref:Uncharacterized protein n=1 Tax=Aphidius gifuensis TaxID=684658 RepID=A0A834XQJ6_APHGI|nr:hypothetical protein HCN44_008233 [Aphidius gifuensis]
MENYRQSINFIIDHMDEDVANQKNGLNAFDGDDKSCYQYVHNTLDMKHQFIKNNIIKTYEYFKSHINYYENDTIYQQQFKAVIYPCFQKRKNLAHCDFDKINSKISEIENYYLNKTKFIDNILLEKNKLDDYRLTFTLFSSDMNDFLNICLNLKSQNEVYKQKHYRRVVDLEGTIKNIKDTDLTEYTELKNYALYLIESTYNDSVSKNTRASGKRSDCDKYYKEKLSYAKKTTQDIINNSYSKFISTLSNEESFEEIEKQMDLSLSIFSNLKETFYFPSYVEEVMQIHIYEDFKLNIFKFKFETFKKFINDNAVDLFHAYIREASKLNGLCNSIIKNSIL